tara:strand:- start:3828 stop:4121 length:294 start_codon:yes stop_codon:yes gene_type:complete
MEQTHFKVEPVKYELIFICHIRCCECECSEKTIPFLKKEDCEWGFENPHFKVELIQVKDTEDVYHSAWKNSFKADMERYEERHTDRFNEMFNGKEED